MIFIPQLWLEPNGKTPISTRVKPLSIYLKQTWFIRSLPLRQVLEGQKVHELKQGLFSHRRPKQICPSLTSLASFTARLIWGPMTNLVVEHPQQVIYQEKAEQSLKQRFNTVTLWGKVRPLLTPNLMHLFRPSCRKLLRTGLMWIRSEWWTRSSSGSPPRFLNYLDLKLKSFRK